MKLQGGVIERAMVEWRIVVTLVAALVAFGVYSLVTMPRQEFPEFTIRQGLVIGVMPGATSSEVEEQLAKPVEEYLFTFQEVDKSKTYSVSRDGRTVVFVEIRESVKGAAAPAFWAKLRHGLNELKAQRLPAKVVALFGNDDFGDTSALLFTVVAEGQSPRDLERHLEVLESHLRRIDATSKLRRYGLQEEVIRVTISQERLARYGVRPATVWMTLQGLGELPAAARLDTDTLELPVHVGRVLRSEKELGDAILLSQPGGAHVRLKDLATITREYGHDDAFVRFEGKTALVLSIEMQKGNDITHFGKRVDEAIAAAARELPPTVQITRVADQPRVVKTSVDHFLRDFGLAILSVIAVTMLLLPPRVAAVAALTIPVCIFMTLGILDALGVEIQTVSLAGLIVVLGMVVDNAIVIIDDHVEKLDAGIDPWTAAWQSVRELLVPVFTATLAIVISYVPFTWFMTGMAGDFIGSLPVTIAVALGTSLAVAALLVPILSARFIRKGLHRSDGGRPSVLDRLQRAFDRSLELAFGRPWLAIGVGVASVAIAGVLGAFVPQQLFPKVDRSQFAVEITLPGGRPLEQTDAVARRVEDALRGDPRVVNVTSFVGTSSPRFHTVYAPAIPARNYAQLLVNTLDEATAVEVLRDAEARFANAFPEGWVRWKQLDLQATPAPIEVRLSGNDIADLRALAARIEAHARSIPGASWVRNDYEEPLEGVEVIPDADACARLGVSPTMLQASLAAGSRKGLPIATIWEEDYPVRVILGDDPRRPETMEAFRQQYVSSPILAAAVPLEQLGDVRPSWRQGAIVRRNGIRTLTVRVDVANGVLATTVQRPLQAFVDAVGPTPGISIGWGGEKEDMERYYGPLARSLLTSVVLIYVILLFQFRRHRKALLVMLTMPLSLLGAMLGLLVTGLPFGLTAFLGVISLMGIVVRNGIILVGYAEELRRDRGLDAREAALAAGKRRMRPIFLTSAAAAVGVTPLIASGSTLWGPLGAVTCFGLLVSMVLTLFVLPVAYWLVVRSEKIPPGARAAAGALLLALACVAAPAAAQDAQDAQDAHDVPAASAEAPLSLDACKALATKRNADVQQAEAEVSAAEETRASARTEYFPQVSAAAGVMSARSPLVGLATPGGHLPVLDAAGRPTGEVAYLPGSNIEAAEHGNLAVASAVQPLFAGGRIVNGNRLAVAGVRAAKDQAALARRDAVAQVEEKYWRVVALAEKDRTLRAYEGLLASLEKQAQDAVAAGLSTRNDLLKVSLERQKAEVDRLRLESGRRLAARDLRRHLGLPEAEAIALADAAPPEPADPAPIRDAQRGAIDRRLEISLLETAVEAEGLKARMERGKGLPTLSVGAQVLRYDVSGLGTSDEALVFAMLNVPLTGAWKGAHETAAARERERAARLRLEDGRRLVALDVSRSWDELEAAWRGAQVADAGVEQAAVNLLEEKDQYASGLETLSDVLEAEVLQHRATDQRIDARIAFALKRSAYLRAIGRE